MKEIKIEIPKGMQVDLEKSDLSKGLVAFKYAEFIWPEKANEIPGRYYYLTNNGSIGRIFPELDLTGSETTKAHMSSLERGEAIVALIQLLELRDLVNQGWVADWDNGFQDKYSLYIANSSVKIAANKTLVAALCFKDEQTAEKFLEKYRDLIEQAKELV